MKPKGCLFLDTCWKEPQCSGTAPRYSGSCYWLEYAKEGRGLERVPAPSEAPGSTNHMAPTFYHYMSVPMEEKWQEQGRGISRRCLMAAALMVVIVAVLVTLLIHFAVRANSRACRDGLRAQDECRNTTHLLQHQLTRAQDTLLQMETQANTCNRTVDSLEKKLSQALKQQALIQELESKVMTLNQELEKLRTSEEASRTPQNSASSMVVSSLLMLAVPLFLLF